LKFAQICSKQALKYTLFVYIQKRPKNGQMTKPLYFWQTVSKRPNGNPGGGGWIQQSSFDLANSIHISWDFALSREGLMREKEIVSTTTKNTIFLFKLQV